MTLLFFTSNARSRYIQDTLNIVALPEGVLYHFRYDEKWVNIDQNQLSELKNKRILVVFADTHLFDGNNRVQKEIEEYQYYPLRFGELFDTYKQGSIIHVYFKLGDFVDWTINTSDQREDNDTVESFLKWHKDNLLKAGTPTTNIFLSKLETNYIEKPQSADNSRAWETIVAVLERVNDYRHAIFYRIATLRKFKKSYFLRIQQLFRRQTRDFEPVDTSVQILPNSSGFVLESGRTYSLELTFYRPNSRNRIDGAIIQPMVDSSFFAFQPQNIDIGFRYEQHSISLIPKVVNQDVYTKLIVSGQELNGNSDKNYIAPRVDLLIRLTYPRARHYGSFVLLFFAQILTIAPSLENILRSLAIIPDAFIDLIIASGPVIGPLFTTFVLFALFRRLPGVK